ncbi:HNH endonuclease [Streptomycetaceae bacterium NBC_01309]
MPWDSTQRRDELPPNWRREIVPRIKKRDRGVCQWPNDRGGICGREGTDVDHIGDPQVHADENLRLLCQWHHRKRTSAQGNAARTRITQRRPPERHPGLI